ncbi:aldo/keto reductase [Allosalinactinospora lopnorensis]|uniref:aldo/keto reductase n=1 Tax=Allosalinactinospora lopnorensis TaxID=1352348 RepID=UPI000623FAB4|nr:aldo/keto reductase [Allosalinactinospora lopnorensis]
MRLGEQPRTVPGTDLTISRAVFGTMTFGSQVEEDDADRMVGQCLEAGITTFDTANSYNKGASEEILGRVLRRRGDDVIVSTKVGNQITDGPDFRGLSADAVRKAADASLRRLGRDHIDIYYLHMPDWDTPMEETHEALAGLVEAGKVRHVGQSNYAAWQITEMHALARRNGWPVPAVSQPMYNLLARRIEEEYLAASTYLGLFNITYNPLAGGLLTGKHRREQDPEEGTRFAKSLYRRRYWNEAQFAAVERLRGIAADADMSLIELAFRWLLAQPRVGAVLLGASSPAQLAANLDAWDGPPPDVGTLQRCDDVWRDLRGPAPAYNR